MKENLNMTELQLSPIKEEFLADHPNKPVVRLIFKAANEYEQKFDKDLALFNEEEALEYLTGIKSISSSTLCGYASVIKAYADLYVQYHPTESNKWGNLRSSQIKTCAIPNAIQEKYVTEEQLEQTLRNVPNPCDKFLVRAFYEGLRGDYHEDVWKAELRDIKENPSATGDDDAYLMMAPSDGRVLRISKKLYQYARESDKELVYSPMDSTKELNLNGKCPYIYKCRNNTEDWDDERKSKARISRRLTVLKKKLGVEWLSAPRLAISGMVVAIKKLAQKKGISELEVLEVPEFRYIRTQYNITSSVYALRDRLAPYFEL